MGKNGPVENWQLHTSHFTEKGNKPLHGIKLTYTKGRWIFQLKSEYSVKLRQKYETPEGLLTAQTAPCTESSVSFITLSKVGYSSYVLAGIQAS